MSVYPAWSAGERITAAKLDAMQWHGTYKTVYQEQVDTTVMTDDTELWVELAATASYYVVASLVCGAVDSGAGNEPHISFEYTLIDSSGNAGGEAGTYKRCQGPAYPGTATSNRENTLMVSALHGLGTDRQYGTVSLTSAAAAMEYLTVHTGGAALRLTARFALANNPAGAGDTARVGVFAALDWLRVA